MSTNVLHDIVSWRRRPGPSGITSVCSAHPLVIEVAMRRAVVDGGPVLIEATCNQVNQEGGYTGMTPAGFRELARATAERVALPFEKVILGGDHLGPNPWKHLPAGEAMDRARAMIGAYAEAGFTKLHLDTSMGCAGERVALGDVETAQRAASLAAVAERATAHADIKPVYIIGTEVPIPGGAMEEITTLAVTSPDAAKETVRAHRRAFAEMGVADAFDRAVGVVVQPGVEFGNQNVITYDRGEARDLGAALADLPGFVFEAHSTDYQCPAALAALVADGFAILKVGPGLTFALREAVYSLDQIAEVLCSRRRAATVVATLERLMVDRPGGWEKYYRGSVDEQRMQRHFSYSDRIRYYWPEHQAAAAVDELFGLLKGVSIPETLISQYLPASYAQVRRRELQPFARNLLFAAVDRVLDAYFAACR